MSKWHGGHNSDWCDDVWVCVCLVKHKAQTRRMVKVIQAKRVMLPNRTRNNKATTIIVTDNHTHNTSAQTQRRIYSNNAGEEGDADKSYKK